MDVLFLTSQEHIHLIYLEKKTHLTTVSGVIVQYNLFQMVIINELTYHEQASNYKSSAQRGKENAEEMLKPSA